MLIDRARLYAGVVLLVAAAGCGDEKGLASVDVADIEVFPQEVTFNQIAIGESETASVTVQNNGGGELIVEAWEWQGAASDFRVDGLDELRVPGQSSRTFDIVYEPTDEAPDDAILSIETNGGRVNITVSSLGQAAVLRTDPAVVDIIADEVGLRTEQTVRIFNGGTASFVLEGVSLVAGTGELQMAPDFDVPITLGSNDEVTLTIAYNPSGRGQDVADLILAHDAANAVDGITEVPVNASVRSSFIVADPPFLGFGSVAVDTTETLTSEIRNEGEATLRVRDLFLNFGSSEDFAIVSFDGVPYVDGGTDPVMLDSGASATLEVAYTPSDNTPDTGEVFVVSNDPDIPQLEIGLGGRLASGQLSVTPEVIAFGNVAQGITVQRTVLIRNVGSEPLTVDAPAIDGGSGSFSLFNGNLLPTTLDPDLGLELIVEFSPTLDGNIDGTLTITSADDPWHSPATVFLNGFGAGEAFCDLEVSPTTINFGLVPRGSERTGRAAVRNRGSGNCYLQTVRLSPPPFGGIGPFGDLFSDAFSLVSVSIPTGTTLAPGGTFFIEAKYAPTSFTVFSEDDFIGDTGSIEIVASDPANPGEDVACGSTALFSFTGFGRVCGINLQATSGVAEVAAIPSEVDFGLVTRGCSSQDITVNVYNIGSAPVTITDVALEACTGEYALTGVPPEVAAGGLTIPSGGSPVPLRVRYTPTTLGESTCQLVVTSDAEAAGRLVVPIVGAGTDSAYQVDQFEQISGQKVDVLYVVDNSGSMSEEQSNLASNFASFIAAAETWENDFQIGVITTEVDESFGGREPGELVGSPRILYNGMSGLASAFSNNAQVGDGGDGTRESGLEAAWLALTDPLISDVGTCGGECAAPYACVANARGTESRCGGYNRSFLREDAALELVFVSDEEDQSRGTVEFYIDFFQSLKGEANVALMNASAIVGPRGGCTTAAAGDRYLDVAVATGGVQGSICSTTFAASLAEIGNRAFGLRVQFPLSRVAEPGTVVVTNTSGVSMSGWTYDAATNSILFTEATTPAPGTEFEAAYTAACF